MNILSFCKQVDVTDCPSLHSHNVIMAMETEIPLLSISPMFFQAIVVDDCASIQSLRQYFRSDFLARIPVILLLKKDVDHDAIRKAFGCGATDFCMEPWTDLKETIQVSFHRLDDMNQSAEEKFNRLRKNLTYIIPHEFNTPITTIQGLASVLVKESTLDPQSIKNFSRHILQSVNRLQRLIDNFVYYSHLQIKLSSESEVLYARSFYLDNPDAIIMQTIHELKYHYKRNINHNLKTGSIQCSETNFYKLIYYLLENSLKFSKKESAVSIDSVTSSNDEYKISIQNEGAGLSPEQIKIMGPFTQFDRHIKEQQGIGMGMAIVLSLVNLYDGRIQIESDPGKFTRIDLYLKGRHIKGSTMN